MNSDFFIQRCDDNLLAIPQALLLEHFIGDQLQGHMMQ
jgi:hypothetical protein